MELFLSVSSWTADRKPKSAVAEKKCRNEITQAKKYTKNIFWGDETRHLMKNFFLFPTRSTYMIVQMYSIVTIIIVFSQHNF